MAESIKSKLRQNLIDQRWELNRVNKYMQKYNEIIACNYVPSYCYNYIQLWYDFRENVISRELDWAKNCNINSLRMFIPLFSFQKDGKWNTVKENVEKFLVMADKRDISIMMTFQPNYIRIEKENEPNEPYVVFKPGRHMNHWNFPNSDFAELNLMPEIMPIIYDFMDDIMGKYKDDRRIMSWDLWNETWAKDVHCLEEIFEHARLINPSQPLTACWEAFDISDVITFHNYVQPGRRTRYPQEGSIDFIPELERALSYNRPVWCTECLARSEGNTFENILPFFKEHHIGFYFWGLCAGAAQYHFPWDWPEGSPEPKDWFHCILYPDGTPYRDHEIVMLKEFKFI